MILFISYGGGRLAITVQPARQALDEPSVQPSALQLSLSLSKALSQTLGGCA